MTNGPRITVCIAAQRDDLFLKRAIHSVKNQTTAPFEVVIVFDGPQNRPSELKDISNAFPNEGIAKTIPEDWMQLWTETPDQNLSNARNIGMHYSRGDWILMLKGDDFLLPSCIEFYTKHISTTKADLITEYQIPSLTHFNFSVSKTIPPDKMSWFDTVKHMTRVVFSGSWKKGELPLNILFIRSDGKKYYPLDYNTMEDKVLILQYMLEERKILLSDYFSYITNVRADTSPPPMKWGALGADSRFRRMASNIQINGWTVKERIFEQIVSHAFPSNWDIDYIDKTVSYFSLS